VTEEELRRLSEANPGYQFERLGDGRVLVSSTGGESGRRSAELLRQLAEWNRKEGRGVVLDASTGFRLPDGSVLSPDAAFVPRQAWEALTLEEREGFLPLAPLAAFEVRSLSQAPGELREKMGLYLANGVRLGVLIDPYARRVEVYRPEGVQVWEEPEKVPLDPELPGFLLELPPLW
jgi:Uma2 family endonuclease